MYSGAALASGTWLSCEFGLTAQDWTTIFGGVGTTVAVVGLLANIWFKAQHLKIARAKAQADPEA